MSVSIERAGEADTVQDGMSAGQVARMIKEMTAAADTTVVVTLDGSDARLLLALDNGRAFIGLERSDGVFQFARPDAPPGAASLTIGGQATGIETRYLVDLATASGVIEEWPVAGEASSLGIWERH